MKKFYIEIPYTGKLMVELEAESEEKALETIYSNDRNDLEKLDNVSFVEAEEDYHKVVVEGNVFHGILNRRKIEIVED